LDIVHFIPDGIAEAPARGKGLFETRNLLFALQQLASTQSGRIWPVLRAGRDVIVEGPGGATGVLRRALMRMAAYLRQFFSLWQSTRMPAGSGSAITGA
jgi:hypothetical protein